MGLLFITHYITTVVKVGPKGITYNAVYAVQGAFIEFRVITTFMMIVATKHHAVYMKHNAKMS